MSEIGEVINQALQMQTKGHEKVEVIAHLLTGLYQELLKTSTENSQTISGVVGFLEFDRLDPEQVYAHIVTTLTNSLGDQGLNFFKNEKLICEKSVNITPQKKVEFQAARKKWSFKMDDNSARIKRTEKSTTSEKAVNREVKFQVYQCSRKEMKGRMDLLTHYELPKKRGYVFLHFLDGKETAPSMESIANALYVIQTLYQTTQKECGDKLKERIFNEIVQTMTLPLVVFDIRGRKAQTAEEMVNPKKLICTYFNNAFAELIDNKKDDNGKKEKVENQVHHQVDQVVKVSPHDQQYKDENHHVFATFLSHPQIYDTMQRVMQHYPLTLSTNECGTEGADLSRSSSGGLAYDQEDAEKEERISETLSIEYGDEIIPHSHYEIDIYRVNGTRVGVVIRDVSEKIQHLQLIEQASRAKSEFLANINHEFRTPLNSIDGNLQLLSRTPFLSDRQRDLIHRMRLAETALMSLLQEVLDYAKLEQHKIILQQETFSLRHCVQAAIDVIQPVVTQKFNIISYEMDIDVPTLVVGDSWRLQQILVNLLTNANNFTKRGTISIKISTLGAATNVAVDAESAFIKFSISDTGSGVNVNIRDSLFLPWVQMDPVNTGGRKGTGLGLAICKELCGLMDGHIWLDSTLTAEEIARSSPLGSPTATGSTFSFQVKLAAAKEEDTLTLAKDELAVLKGKQVLIVYENDNSRRGLVKSFLGWGIRPTSCETAEEARDFLQADCKFDLLLIGEIISCKGNDQYLGAPYRGDRGHTDSLGLIELATWVTMNFPDLSMIAIGEAKCAHDEDCLRLFRTVIQSPVNINRLFHMLVNLFMEIPKKQDSGPKLITNNAVGASDDDDNHSPEKEKGLKCLIVEDVEENKQVLIDMLNYLGQYDVTCAGNGKEMLEILQHPNGVIEKFDVVFVDLLMPIMGGLEAVKIYREKAKLGTRPFIVAVTATSFLTGEKSSYQKAGMDAFIQKPIKMSELKTLLEVIKTT